MKNLTYLSHLMGQPAHPLSRQARTLRLLHTSIGIAELGCLGYVWFCALSRPGDRWLNLSAGVLAGEGVALLLAKGCPIYVFQRRGRGRRTDVRVVVRTPLGTVRHSLIHSDRTCGSAIGGYETPQGRV